MLNDPLFLGAGLAGRPECFELLAPFCGLVGLVPGIVELDVSLDRVAQLCELGGRGALAGALR